MDNKKIGQFLRDLRHEQNLTQEELGEKLGATNKTISRWETGTYMPPVDILLAMSKLYNVSINEILSGERLATADYQPKAEENIVTTLQKNTTNKKLAKKVSIILSAVIIVLVIAAISLLGAFLGLQKIVDGTSDPNRYIIFNTNGGEKTETFYDEYNGGPIAEPQPCPTKKGYSFVGWYSDVELTKRWDFDDTPYGGMNLYAKWEQATDGLLFTKLGDLFEDSYGVRGISDSSSCKEVVIPSCYQGRPVVYIKDEAFSCSNIESVVIPDTVVLIQNSAFYNCANLKSVKLSNNSQLRQIELLAFSGCTKLRNLVLPQQLSVICSSAFSYCSSLITVIIPDSVTTIAELAFSNCSNLFAVTIGASVNIMYANSFQECGNIAEIYNKSKFNITNLGNGGEYDFPSALNIHTPSSGYSKLVSVGEWLFYDDPYCPLLVGYFGEEADIVLPSNFNGRQYGIRDCAFASTNVRRVELPSFITSISAGLFKFCSNLDSVTGLDNVVEIGDYAFADCNGLTKFIFPNKLQTIGEYAFANSGLRQIEFPNNVKSVGEYAFDNCMLLSDVQLNDGLESIGSMAFKNCIQLEHILLPKSVNDIGINPFVNCENLRWIEVDKGNSFYYSDYDKLIKTADKTLISLCKYGYVPTNGSVTALGGFYACVPTGEAKIPSAIKTISTVAYGYGIIEDKTVVIFDGTMEQWRLVEYIGGSHIFWRNVSKVVCTDGEILPPDTAK